MHAYNDASAWVKSMACSEQSHLFVAGVWWIWLRRNSLLFNEELWSVNDVFQKAFVSQYEFVAYIPLRNRVITT